MPWRPTYDTFATKEAAAKAAAKRQSQAITGRTFAVKRKGDRWTVMYREGKTK